MRERRSTQAILLCLLALALLTGLDLWTKAVAVEHLSCSAADPGPCQLFSGMERGRGEPLVLIEDYLQLRYAENRGAAFSMLRDAPDWVRSLVFGGSAIGFSVALLWMFATGSGGTLFAWAVPLVVSGALGNLVDRWRLGYVVDFIRVHVADSWSWPTFNIADCTIFVGAALLILDGMGTRDSSKSDAKDDSRADAVGNA